MDIQTQTAEAFLSKKWMSAAVASPFGKLLRRSKFASYDPSIGQVYTTYGGHANRGNWGVKRPLPNRRKSGFITIRSVDSKEQQTEWNSAESSARWIRRWDEMGKKLQLSDPGPWRSKDVATNWHPNSEFCSKSFRDEHMSTIVNRRLSKTPPFSAKRFERYLQEIRSARSSFKDFLKEELQRQESRSQNKSHPAQQQRIIKAFGSGEVDLYSTIQGASDVFATQFQKKRIRTEFESLDSSAPIGSEPHINGGLDLTVLSPLQIRYLYGSSPGRIIARNVPSGYKYPATSDSSAKVDIATVGGIVAEIHSKGRTGADYGTTKGGDAEMGVDNLRIARIDLVEPPFVVGRRPGKAADTVFDSIKAYPAYEESNVSNPYPLGSRDYVGKIPSDSGEAKHIPRAMTHKAQVGKKLVAPKTNRTSSRDLLTSLEKLSQRVTTPEK